MTFPIRKSHPSSILRGNDTMIPINQSEKLWDAVALKAPVSACGLTDVVIYGEGGNDGNWGR